MFVEDVLFRPALEPYFAARFYEKIRSLFDSSASQVEIEKVVKEEVQWAVHGSTVNTRQRKIYRAVWLLFRDLLRAGWTFAWKEGRVQMSAPKVIKSASTLQAIQEAKAFVRRKMAASRLERVMEAKEFIERVENPSSSASAHVPISKLVADAQALAEDMHRIASITDRDLQAAELKQAVRPYLQLVQENTRCSETNHKLSDIWRYFRLTWAIPPESTPGRTIQYLIRDAARPYHPVIGIGSLENTPVLIASRDDYIGWTPKAFRKKLENLLRDKRQQGCADSFEVCEAQVRLEFTKLLENIEIALKDINLEGLCKKSECKNPTKEVIERLSQITSKSAEARISALRDWATRGDEDSLDDDDDVTLERSELGNISTVAEEALYRRKRAERLGKLLSAKLTIQQLLKAEDFNDRWLKFISSEAGESVVRNALHAVKIRHIGTSMLELNVCGAIPPYNELLGGKLVALLMTSPQVVSDYRKKYGNRPSEIATRMKGKKVVRPAELVFVGTTSLYRVGSSQYNRLRLPPNLLKQGAPKVEWLCIGETSGYGSMHISHLTLQCLEEAASKDGTVQVNHVFGEGASPKMRAFRWGLEAVLDPKDRSTLDEIRKHAANRLVYGVFLASNGRAYLNGEATTPEYYFDASQDAAELTERIVDFWRQRWLLPRILKTEIISRLSEFQVESILVSRDLGEGDLQEFEPITEFIKEDGSMSLASDSDSDVWREFIRNLYRGSSSYADNMDSKLLAAIHAETSLDQAVLDALTQGKSVVLTGNPGDGKSHLQKILVSRLEELPSKPVIELDASAVTNSDLKENWENAIGQGRPFFLAINEAVLVNLANEYKEFQPLQEALCQVENALVYRDFVEQDFSVVVFDLSHRNILSSDIVGKVIDTLTNPKRLKPCAKCPAEGCDLVRNQRLLRTERVKQRLQNLLNRVSSRGHHATLRQLHSLISYLLFGDRSCEALLRSGFSQQLSFSQLLFTGQGKLFDVLRQTFDPVRVSHPILDDRLLNADTLSSDWLDEWHSELDAIERSDWRRFEARKRAFYFCHKDGEELLTLSDDDETAFVQFLEMSKREALRTLINRINFFFGDNSGGRNLRIWQSHRYNQSPRRVLYSAITRPQNDFDILYPSLRPSMAQGFALAKDHLLLCLKSDYQVSLRVDFSLFQTLLHVEQGIPAISLENDSTRRLWQFMERLNKPLDDSEEYEVFLLDLETKQQLVVTVDVEDGKYLNID